MKRVYYNISQKSTYLEHSLIKSFVEETDTINVDSVSYNTTSKKSEKINLTHVYDHTSIQATILNGTLNNCKACRHFHPMPH